MWTRENEIYCQRLGEMSSVYNWMNLQEETRCRNMLIYTSVLANGSAVISAVIGIIDSFSPSIYLRVLNSVSSAAAAGLIKYHTSSKWREMADIHKKTASTYAKLSDDIQYQLILPDNQRENAIAFITKIRQIYNELLQSGPPISQNIIDTFNEKYKFNSVTKPILVGEIDQITVTNSVEEVNAKRSLIEPVTVSKSHSHSGWKRSSGSSSKIQQFSYIEYAKNQLPATKKESSSSDNQIVEPHIVIENSPEILKEIYEATNK